MGLRIWLPLNGDLENKGLDDIVITNNGATIDNNGKIGKCYSFDGTDDYINITNVNYPNIFVGSFSICFWVYSNTDGSRDVYFGNYGLSGSGNWFNIEKNTNNELRFWWNNGSPNKYFTSYHILNSEGWTHVALTRFENTIKVYKNGILIESYTTTLSNNVPTTATMFVIGGDYRHSGDLMLGGKMNDFRLYDEALSPMQIKLISQGLVAHYLLNNSGIPNSPNLLKKQIKETAWSLWGNGDATREKITIDNKVWAHVIQNDTTRYDGFTISPENNGIIIDHNRQYVISFTAKKGSNQPNSEIIIWWHWRSTESGANISQSSVKINISDNTPHRYSYIIPKYSNATYDVNRINIMMGSYKANNEVYFTDIKFEEGDTATSWIPNKEDAEYTALGLNNNIEYDVSGYCNNGIKYNITDYVTDSPRYSLATKFNGTNSYIDIGRGGMVRDEITVNVWGYLDDWTKYNGKRFISCTESGGWNFESASNSIRFSIGTGNTSNTYVTGTLIPYTDLTAGWHMFTGIFDGFNNITYLDGNLVGIVEQYTTKTPVFYNKNNAILIGSEATGSHAPGGAYYNGNLSDVRIYATALSESDIQSLYNNSAFIDSSGNVYSTEYTES